MRSVLVVLLLVPLAGCFGGGDAPEGLVVDAPPEAMAPESDTPYSAPPMADGQAWPPLGNPLHDGNITWERSDYDLGSLQVGGPDASHSEYEYEARIRGTLTMPEGAGPFPFAVFLHGQHRSCSTGDGQTEGSDCSVPYRNDLGYTYLQDHLASHGIASASILGFEVNQLNGAGDVGMFARGELVIATLDAFAGSDWSPKLNFAKVALMGHSRGGEGVVTAVEVNSQRAAPYNLAGVLPLAPTDFAYRNVTNVPMMVVLPYCDGDVFSLHGARTYDESLFRDDATTKIQVLVMGANHNNYNTMWGRPPNALGLRQGDDAPEGSHMQEHCSFTQEQGGGRLTLDETYQEAILHMGGFLRWVLLDDPRLVPFLVDDRYDPVEACPQNTSNCAAEWLVSSKPAASTIISRPGGDGLLFPSGGGALTDIATSVCTGQECDRNMYGTGDYALLEWSSEGVLSMTTNNPLPAGTLHIRVGIDSREGPIGVRGGIVGAKAPSLAIAFDQAAPQPVSRPALALPPAQLLYLEPPGMVGNEVGSTKVVASDIILDWPGGASQVDLHWSGGSGRVFFGGAWHDSGNAFAFA